MAFKKGRVLSADDVAALTGRRDDNVTAARLEPGDVGEDEPPRRIAEAVAGPASDGQRAPSPAAPICSPSAPGSAWSIVERLDASTCRRIGDHRDPARLRSVEREADGGDAQDHPLRGAEARRRCGGGSGRRRRGACPCRRIPAARSCADPDPAARHQGNRARQDRRGHRATRLAALGGDADRRDARARIRKAPSPTPSPLPRAERRPAADRGRLGHHRPARCDAGGDRARGRQVEHFGMPVDPGNLLLLGAARRHAGTGPARLRPLAQAERLRLGAAADRRGCR